MKNNFIMSICVFLEEVEYMKTRLMSVILIVVLGITTLVGCGESFIGESYTKEDYEHDIKVLMQAENKVPGANLDPDEIYSNKLEGLTCNTRAGKAVLYDHSVMFELYDKINKLRAEGYDTSAVMEELAVASISLQDHYRSFTDEALKMGVDVPDIVTTQKQEEKKEKEEKKKEKKEKEKKKEKNN